MELWLLGAGALLLIAITVWIVWPAQPEETIAMNPETTNPSNLPPQGDAFEDQYTSATADLSAGGVATSLQQETEPPASAGEPWSATTQSREGTGDRFQTPVATSHTYPGTPALAQRPMITIGSGALMAAGGAVAGVWLYTRWQERNKPVNRFRRRARDMASHLPDVTSRLPDVAGRLPDVDELPSGAGPAGAALLLTSVVLARALRGSDAESQRAESRVAREGQVPLRDALAAIDWTALLGAAQEIAQRRGERMLRDLPSADDARKQGRRWLRQVPNADHARKQGRRWLSNVPGADDVKLAKKPLLGLGFGGVTVVAAGSYLVWRLLRGSA